MHKTLSTNSSSKPKPDEVLRRNLGHALSNYQNTHRAVSSAEKESGLILELLTSFSLFFKQLEKNESVSKSSEILETLFLIQSELNNTQINKKYKKSCRDMALGELLMCLRYNGIAAETAKDMVAKLALLSPETARNAREIYENSFDTNSQNFDIEAQIQWGPYKSIIQEYFKKRDLIADKNHKDYETHTKAIEKTKEMYK